MIKIYRVIKGGRNCLSAVDGSILRPGDYISAYGQFMFKLATSTSRMRTTSMFVSEAEDLEKWGNIGKYHLVTSINELSKLVPHLPAGRTLYCLNIKDEVRQYVLANSYPGM